MNQSEYAALDNSSLTPAAVTLYVLGFRRFMNYRDGTTAVSLSRLRHTLEFVPPPGSTKPMIQPSVSQVRHLIQTLTQHGLIKCTQKGDKTTRTPAVFACTLATFGRARALSGQNEERHESDTRTTRPAKPPHPAPDKAAKQNVVNFQKAQERHCSDRSEKRSVCNARAMSEISFTQSFQDVASRCQLAKVTSDPAVVFTAFQSSPKYRHRLQSELEYLADWQTFCAYWVANRQANATNKPPGGNHASHPHRHNASAEQMHRAKHSAEHNAEHGIDLSILDQGTPGA